MKPKNPFPGMNPFFELQWRDTHTTVIAYIGDALQEVLPPDLVAQTEEEVVAIGAGGWAKAYRPDVQVQQPWTLKEPSVSETTSGPSPVPAEPVRVLVEDEVERWVEIRETTGRLVTVLELLSPSNKIEPIERERYQRKRNAFVSGGVNVVEIDLVRQGTSVFPEAVRRVLAEARACYGACAYRADRFKELEVYPMKLRERLPVIRIPLRVSDADVTLALQTLIDQCYERRRRHLLNYRLPLDPPLPAEDAAWAEELLRRHQLV